VPVIVEHAAQPFSLASRTGPVRARARHVQRVTRVGNGGTAGLYDQAMTTSTAGPDSFTQAEMAEAALAILRKDGAQALSLRRLADALGTYHVAVFRRCGGVESLLDICADHVAASFPILDDTMDWAEATQARFEAAYAMWAENVELVILMRGRAWQGLNMQSRFYEPAMRTLLDAGLSAHDAATLFSILYRLTIGSVIAVRANPWTPSESMAALDSLGAENFPSLVKVRNEVDISDINSVFRTEVQSLLRELGPKPGRKTSVGANGATKQ
jgi:AcrR family transcriptional regulator